jgi:hypothetical protein
MTGKDMSYRRWKEQKQVFAVLSFSTLLPIVVPREEYAGFTVFAEGHSFYA